ncbi:MAG: Adenosylhomocysteinase, partial [uncultured Ramlibacter sp.]
ERRSQAHRRARQRHRRPFAGRLGPQGNPHRRDRDARPDGDPPGIRQGAAAQGRAHHRLAAHDHPDGRADRDAAGAGRPGPLGLVQHLLDAGPRRGRHRRCRHAGVRHQGRVAGRLLGLHPPHLRLRRQGLGRRRPQHDPGRRRRCHAADAPGPALREGPVADRQPLERGRAHPARGHPQEAGRRPDLVQPQGQGHHRRHRGDDHRRAPPGRHVQQGPAEVPRDQRQRLGHQEQVRQPVRLPRVAGGRHQARHRRDDRRQGGRGGRLRRRGQGQRPGPACAVGPGLGHRDRPDQRPPGRHGRLPRRHHGLRRRQGRHLRDGHRQQGRDHLRPHGEDEGPGDRLQHRPLRQRDRRGDDRGQVQVGRDQAAGGPRDLPGRQAHHPARQGPAGEPGLRHGPPELRDVVLVRQPDAGADRAVHQAEGIRSRQGVRAAQAPRRKGRAPAVVQAGRATDRVDRSAGRVHRREQERPVQGRYLPLL